MPRKVRTCPYCQRPVLDHTMLRHLETCQAEAGTSHAERVTTSRKRRLSAPVATEFQVTTRSQLKPGQQGAIVIPPLRIYSKRGIRCSGRRLCAQCRRERLETYRYSRSNRGTVYLCRECHMQLHPSYLGVLVVKPLQGGDFRSR